MGIIRNTKLVSDQGLQALFAEYESKTTVVDGGLKYTTFGALDGLNEILPDAFTVTPPLRRETAIRVFGTALRNARRSGPLNAEALMRAAKQILRADRAVPQETFTLWTKFLARNMNETPGFRMVWEGVSVRTANELPRWLQVPRQTNPALGAIESNQPTDSGYVILSCRERNQDDAVDRMLDALQLIMGLLNLYETRGRWTWMAGPQWAAGKLWLGPFQFVFRGRKFLGEEKTWYNPNFNAAAWKRQMPTMADFRSVIPNARAALAALANHSLKGVLVRALQLMQDGFETRDGNHRLLRFWAALEKLYVEEGARERSNEKVIRRATFAVDDFQLAQWKLSHIARVRNEHVHSRGHDDDLMNLGQYLRDLLYRHIHHWTYRGADFQDHQSLLNFVDLPRDDDSLTALRCAIDRRMALNELRRRSA